MRDRVVQESLWGAEFSLWYCRTFASRDVYIAAGCMTRVAQYLVQALFALNREYFISDKYAKLLIEGFASKPDGFFSRLEIVLSKPGLNSDELRFSVESLSALWRETVEFTAGTYKPRFDL